ncbi:MAG: four helix bundle protein [Nitrospira sp.]|nr:four helix bundle protein [Nitrospira sp.]
MKDFKELKVWEKAHTLTKKVYKTTLRFPKEELYGLTSQIRRASVSIPNNIAEGCGRRSDTELARFLDISMGSASELEYLILLTKDLDMLSQKDYFDLTSAVIEIKRMLATFIKKLRADR